MASAWKATLVPPLASGCIRAVVATLRVRVEDPGRVTREPLSGPVIWAFWHNRVFVLPWVRTHLLTSRHVTVLTSASRDGELLARTVRRFGMHAVRGSSSRRGSAALRALVEEIRSGRDVAMTPDGPRGPRYVVQPGLIKLAEISGAPVIPVHVGFSRALRLRSWDRFRIPVPFSRIRLVFHPAMRIPAGLSEEGFESARREVETVLKACLEEDGTAPD